MVDTYSAAFRKAVFFQVGGFDQSFPAANNEDTDLSYKLSAMGQKMVFAPQAAVYHLQHPASPARYFKQKFWRGYWRTVVYQRFPQKAVKDTYTPQTLKIQIFLIFALLGILFFSMLWPKGFYFAFLVTGLYLISTAPFLIFAFRRDRQVGLLSPFFLAWRSLSIGLGVLYSVFKKKFL
jgi:GT2 family glycosyltransferase